MSKPASARGTARSKRAMAKPGRSSVARRVQSLAATPAQVRTLFQRIAAIVEEARARVVRSVNSEIVLAYWQIGREIVEHVQAGDARADYGKQVLETLSSQLTARFGRGYSATNLRYFRLFYEAYAERAPEVRPLPEIHHKAGDESATGAAKHHELGDVSARLALAATPESSLYGFSERLSWSHYRAHEGRARSGAAVL